MSSEVTRIELKMSRMAKLLFWPTALVSLCLALVDVVILATHPPPSLTQIGTLALGVVFFGGGAVLIFRIMIRKAGFLELREDGLLLDTYLTAGFLPWDQITAVGVIRAMGVKYLGIAVKDVDTFTASRAKQPRFTRSRDRALTQAFTRLMMATPATKLVNVPLYILGYTKIPDSPSESDLLKWNKDNFGHHILIHRFWFPNINEAIEIISAHNSSRSVSPMPVKKAHKVTGTR